MDGYCAHTLKVLKKLKGEPHVHMHVMMQTPWHERCSSNNGFAPWSSKKEGCEYEMTDLGMEDEWEMDG